MDPALREQLRLNLLQQLEAAGPFGFTVAALLTGARTQGYGVTEADVRRELEYLADPAKGLVAVSPKLLSPELRRHKITAAGRDWLAENA